MVLCVGQDVVCSHNIPLHFPQVSSSSCVYKKPAVQATISESSVEMICRSFSCNFWKAACRCEVACMKQLYRVCMHLKVCVWGGEGFFVREEGCIVLWS